MVQTLKINAYEVWVSLGCSKEEQSLAQPVHVDIVLVFKNQCVGAKTDNLIDSLDYVALTNTIKAVAQNKSYQLIEHLCFSIHEKLLLDLKKHNFTGQLTTSAKKIRPPVNSLQGGVEFLCQSEVL